jgi:hypothetical protein
LSGSIVTLPDFAPEGRSATVVVSESARLNAGRTLDIVASRLDAHRGGRWLDIGSLNGARMWSIGDVDDGLEVEVQYASEVVLASASPSCIVVRMLDFVALKVSCRPAQANGLVREGPSAAVAWAVAACRLALAHGRRAQAAGWTPKPALVASLRALHDESIRYGRGHVCVLHPSPLSDAGATVCMHDDHRLHETIVVDPTHMGFAPARPCRLVARSRLGAAGRNSGAPPGVQLVAPITHASLEALDPMQILRLLADGRGRIPLKGRRRR